MKKIIALLLFSFISLNSHAQKIAYYKVSIVYEGGLRENGWLYDFKDNEISLIDLKTNPVKDLAENKEFSIKKVPITSNIKRITLHRKGKFLRTLGTLTSISLGGGLLVGYILGDSKNDGEWFSTWESKALIGALVGMYGTLYSVIPLSILPNKIFYKRKLTQDFALVGLENYTFVSQLNFVKERQKLLEKAN